MLGPLWEDDAKKVKIPPPKPPRMHLKAPVIVQPLQDRSNNPETPPLNRNGRFSATDARRQLIQSFRDRVMKEGDSFSGREGLDAMVVMILQKNDFSLTKELAEEKALKMLDHWMEERVIRPCIQEYIEDDRPFFVHNTKVFYTVNPDSLHRVVMMTPGSASRRRDASLSRERPKRNPSRKGSFKRIFGLGSSQDDAPPVSLEIENQPEEEVSRRSSFGRAFQRVFNSAPIDAKQEDALTLTDEAIRYEVSLERLLLEVEVPVLDDILMIKEGGQEQSSVSLLSSILKKMGLSSSYDETRPSDGKSLVAMDTVLGHNSTVDQHREVLDWFRAAHRCSLSLVLPVDHTLHHGEQLFVWGKEALKAVSARYSNLTQAAQSPLIPAEFNQILEAIAAQNLIDNQRTEAKKHRVFKLLWWMIPSKLRSHLSDILTLLLLCDSIEGVFNLNAPYFVPKKSQLLCARNSENYSHCLAELRPYIVSREARLRDDQKNAVVEALVVLRRMNSLSTVDDVIQNEIDERKSGVASTPVVYCRGKAEPLSDRDQGFVDMIKGIIEATHWTGREKENKIRLCKQTYPEIMKSHFPNY